MELDSVQIGVRDMEAAARDYERLLGLPAVHLPSGAQRFQLERGAVEVVSEGAGLQSIRFVVPGGSSTAPLPDESFHGLRVRIDAMTAAAPAVHSRPDGIDAIDHVVIQCANLDRAIALWRDRLGLRLALDREFPKRGLRMLFFRSGGMTLEFVSTVPPPADRSAPDSFYGLAYRVRDLEACRQRLLAAGLDLSAVRPGQKRDTLVATVRSGTGGVPTLLIEDRSRPS